MKLPGAKIISFTMPAFTTQHGFNNVVLGLEGKSATWSESSILLSGWKGAKEKITIGSETQENERRRFFQKISIKRTHGLLTEHW